MNGEIFGKAPLKPVQKIYYLPGRICFVYAIGYRRLERARPEPGRVNYDLVIKFPDRTSVMIIRDRGWTRAIFDIRLKY